MKKKQEDVTDILMEMAERIRKAKSQTRDNWEGSENDELYDGFIFSFRFPGMGNSSQALYGNKITLMTLLSSTLSTAVRRGVITKKDLKAMIDMVLEELDKE